MENTSAALCNMVGEVIGTIAYLNALLIGSSRACFLGRTSYLSEVTKGIDERLQLAGISGSIMIIESMEMLLESLSN